VSQENVEIVKRAINAATRRPKPDFDVVNVLFDARHEFVSRLTGVEGAAFPGVGGFREWLAKMDEAWERWEWKLERVTDLGGDRVLVVASITAHSRLGGVPLESESALVTTVCDRKIVRSEGYASVEQALKAVGLEE
jgi:ketosteroid isomerase-like protein